MREYQFLFTFISMSVEMKIRVFPFSLYCLYCISTLVQIKFKPVEKKANLSSLPPILHLPRSSRRKKILICHLSDTV